MLWKCSLHLCLNLDLKVALATGSEPRLLWGALEAFHWADVRRRPIGYMQDGPSHQVNVTVKVKVEVR